MSQRYFSVKYLSVGRFGDGFEKGIDTEKVDDVELCTFDVSLSTAEDFLIALRYVMDR